MEGFLWQAFVTLFVIIDPFAVLPMFIALTRNDSIAHKRHIALKSTLIATILLLIFAFVGDQLLDAMGISEPAFRIAGGFLLLLAAIDMVIAKPSGIRSTTEDETAEAAHRDDVSVFPLAIPLMAGPGALTSIVVLMRQAEAINMFTQLGIIIILITVLLITYLCLLAGDHILKFLGVTGTNVMTRVFGVILSALAMQNIIAGINIIVNSFING